MLKIVNKGSSERGYLISSIKLNSFTRRPVNIRRAMLKPDEKRTNSKLSSLSNFSNFRVIRPKKKVKHRNPAICLTTGMSRSTATSNVNCKNSIDNKNCEFIDKAFNSYFLKRFK
jgi:hypothetical protein